MIFSFGAFELDDRLYQLRRRGTVVKLEPKVFDVLLHLVRHRERVVSKDELLETLWPGEFVSESVLPRCIAAARKALGDARHRPAFIATVHGRGYRFLATIAATADGHRPGQPSSPPSPGEVFVGRDDAMTVLRQGLADATAGRGRLILLVGEPGIGKTRTAEEIAAEAARAGALVVNGRCYEGDGAPAFWPWVQVLRACADDRSAAQLRAELGPGAAEVAELVPDLRRRFPDLPASPPIESDQARFRLFDSITTFLRRLGSAQVVVVILDDLHWADPSSLQVLQFLARNLRRLRVFVIGTYRDVDLRRQHPLAQVLGELAREPVCERVLLRGLEAADLRRFIERAAGRAPGDALVAAVARMTEGNPFFVGEIVRWLAAQGQLPEPAGGAPAWDVILPQGVREAIGRRLDTLSEQTNQVLGVAAVIGREFGLVVLERLTGLDGEHLLAVLDDAVAARIVQPLPGGLGLFAFTHTLTRQTLYEELSAPQRARLHGRVGEVLEILCRDDPAPRVAELAHHFFQSAPAGNVAKAIDYATRAAAQAVRLLAYEEAVAHYARALQLLDLESAGAAAAADARRGEILLALGDAHAVLGQRAESQSCCRQAAALARRLDRPDLLARAALGFGQHAELGPFPAEELRHLLEEALRVLPEDALALRARVTSRLSGTAPYQHSMSIRAALSQQAVQLATPSGDGDALFDALGARLWALLGPDDDDERVRVSNEVAALAERGGHPERLLLAHEHRLRSFLSAGDLPAADREHHAYERLARDLRQPVYAMFAELYHVGRALGDGRCADAEVHIERSLALGQRLQQPSVDAIGIWQIYWLLHQQGRIDELAPTLAAMPERYAQGGGAVAEAAGAIALLASPEALAARYPFAPALQRAAVASWHVETGARAAARDALAALAAERFADVPRDEWWMATVTLLAEVTAAVGDTACAADLHALLLPMAAKNAAHLLIRTYGGAVAHFLGILAYTMGDLDTAARHFEDALDLNARMRALPALARTQYEYACLLGRRDRKGDRGQARALLRQGLQTATDLGLTGLHRKIEPALSGLGNRRAVRQRAR